MRYPPVKLMKKPRHWPSNCPLPMAQEGQNGTRDGPQNRDVGIVVIKPLTHERDEKTVHNWCALYRRFQ
jgi:hypothetical protein